LAVIDLALVDLALVGLAVASFALVLAPASAFFLALDRRLAAVIDLGFALSSILAVLFAAVVTVRAVERDATFFAGLAAFGAAALLPAGFFTSLVLDLAPARAGAFVTLANRPPSNSAGLVTHAIHYATRDHRHPQQHVMRHRLVEWALENAPQNDPPDDSWVPSAATRGLALKRGSRGCPTCIISTGNDAAGTPFHAPANRAPRPVCAKTGLRREQPRAKTGHSHAKTGHSHAKTGHSHAKTGHSHAKTGRSHDNTSPR
jgi:hypothetical protein